MSYYMSLSRLDEKAEKGGGVGGIGRVEDRPIFVLKNKTNQLIH